MSFTHKMAAKGIWHRNYVTVTLCVCDILVENIRFSLTLPVFGGAAVGGDSTRISP